MRKIKHPNIIKLDSVFEEKESFNLITEYVPSGNLYDYIKKNGVLTENESLILLETLLKIVDYLSEQNIIHRDIKPENIMLRRPQITFEDIVLIDFGFAVYSNECPKELKKCGSPGFISPENLTSKTKDVILNYKSGIFSVGITWYYSLFGCLPYGSKSKANMLHKNKHALFEFENSNKFKKIENALKMLIEKNQKKRIDARTALNSDFLFNLRSQDGDFDESDGGKLFENISNLLM